MGWRRSFRQSRNLPITVAGFALLQKAAASFYAAKFLRRRIRPMLGVLLFLLISVTSTITFAQEPSPVQKAAENYYPKIAKKFPPNRTTTCPEKCKRQQEDLNVAWQELYRFDQDHPDVRALHKTYNEEFAAKDALEAAKKAGAGVQEAEAAVAKAKANSEAVEKKLKITSKPFQDAESALDKIYQKIKKAADALEDCEKNCPKSGNSVAQCAAHSEHPPVGGSVKFKNGFMSLPRKRGKV